MSDENKIKLSNFTITMEFDIQPYDGEMFEHGQDITCVEDIWYILGLVQNRKYKEVFPDDYDVAYSEFTGLRIKANDESNKNNVYFLLNTRPYGNITIDYSNLNDENANKIQEIRKIIGR